VGSNPTALTTHFWRNDAKYGHPVCPVNLTISAQYSKSTAKPFP
jgi:hypothetical protein